MTPKQRTILFLVLGACLIFFVGKVGIQNRWTQERTKYQAILKTEKQKLTLLSILQKDAKLVNKIERHLITTGGTSTLTSQVTQMATSAGVRVDSVKPLSDTSYPPYVHYRIELTGKARYQQLLKFLRLLETQEPPLQIMTLDLGQQMGQVNYNAYRSRGFQQNDNNDDFTISDDEQFKLVVGSFGKDSGGR